MPKSARQRARAANRARTQIYHRSRSSRATQRKAMVALGIFVALALIITLVATVGSSSPPPVPTPAASDQGPQSLVAAATATPNDPDTVSALADYFDTTAQYDRLTALYQSYLKARPTDVAQHIAFGDMLRKTGDLQGALAQYMQAIALHPDSMTEASAHLGLGDVYSALKPPRLADALTEYQTASRLDPYGSTGDQARVRIAEVQQQLNTPASGSAPARTPPSGTP
jgi:tetratricopeptide (TPR) repeat protein